MRRFLPLLALLAAACGTGAEPEPAPERSPGPAQGRAAPLPATPPERPGGCDMAGIQAAVRATIGPRGAIGRCYRTHEPGRRTGRVLFRIVLDPRGRAAAVDLLEDGLGNAALGGCLQGALAAIAYPPPGDVPCTAIYPLSFQ